MMELARSIPAAAAMILVENFIRFQENSTCCILFAYSHLIKPGWRVKKDGVCEAVNPYKRTYEKMR